MQVHLFRTKVEDDPLSEIRRVQPRRTDPNAHEWSGSMEGLPEWVDPIGPQNPQPWQRSAQALFEALAGVLPGLTVAAVIAFGGTKCCW